MTTRRNPLFKRLPRELISDIGKYVVLFIFMCLLTAFISGYIVANNSMLKAYNESFDKYEVENGHFILALDKVKEKILEDYEDMFPEIDEDTGAFEAWMIEGYREDLSDEISEKLEEEVDKYIKDVEATGVKVERMYFKDKEVASGALEGDTIRIFKDRKGMNRVELWQGKMPGTNSSIVIDRLYAVNNGVKIGDKMDIDGKNFIVVGFVALSDYSTMFETSSQLMFDANHFSVAIVTDEAWDDLSEAGIKYCYSWRNDDQTLDDKAQIDKGKEILDILEDTKLLTDLTPRPTNPAITFTGDDIGSDLTMMNWLFYITMAVMAFVFAVSAKATIEKDSSAIGTLRASGFTRGEILRHYIALPMIVTCVAAVIGTILGYTLFKLVIVQAYYHSYSLTRYETIWSSRAFWQTVVVPLVMIFVINFVVLSRALRFTPLQFLRHDLRSHKNRNAISLPNWSFMRRFRARIILQNKGAYLTMFVGIFFASILLVFGIMMSPLMEHFRSDVLSSKFADYQYVLKAPKDAHDPDAEKYCITSLLNESDEDITVYGIIDGSAYFSEDLPDYSAEDQNKEGHEGEYPVLASSSYMQKYRLSVGDTLDLREEFDDGEYTFYIQDEINYPSSLAVFMDIDEYRKVFEEDEDYYTGYFSNHELTKIPEEYIATVITERDLTLIADQMEDSMGTIFTLFGGFAVIMFVALVYLLSRITVERNTYSISMAKILGYTDKEISGLYNRANGIVAVTSLIISMFLAERTIYIIYFAMLKDYPGWLSYYIAPKCFVELIVLGLLTYFLVSAIMMRKIKRIPMAEALKDSE